MGDNTYGPEADAPVDLSALRPALGAVRGGPAAAGGAARWEALALRIEQAAAPELARRAAAGTPVVDLLPLLARALRPALAAAAAAVLFAVGMGIGRGTPGVPTPGALAETDAVPAGQLVSEAQVAQALRVGEAEATWLAEGAAPSRDALARAVGLSAGDDAGPGTTPGTAPADGARDSAGGGS